MTDQELGRKLEKLLADQPRELTTTDLFRLLKELLAQNRRLREALQEIAKPHGEAHSAGLAHAALEPQP